MESFYTQKIIDSSNLKNAQEAFDNATELNKRTNEESNKLYSGYFDRILTFSFGTFTFTFALVSFGIEKNIQSLTKVVLLLPNIGWMYISWTLFFITGAFILLSKKMQSHYIGSAGFERYTQAYKELEAKILDYTEKYPDEVLLQDNFQTFEKIKTGNIKLLAAVNANHEKDKKKYFFFARTLEKLSELFVLVATLVLLLFALFFTKTILWG